MKWPHGRHLWPNVIKSLEIRGEKPFYFRAGTSDESILAANVEKPEYLFPLELKPHLIFDIGANIGVVTRMLARIYPNAVIHAFEPEPNNFALLKKNTEGMDAVHLHQCAVGDQTGKTVLNFSDDATNHGGFSLHPKGSDLSKNLIVRIESINFICADLGAPDLMKIDTEGSEFAILTSMKAVYANNVKWIAGELHGHRDFELLDYLDDQYHLHLNKQLTSRVHSFHALLRSHLFVKQKV